MMASGFVAALFSSSGGCISGSLMGWCCFGLVWFSMECFLISDSSTGAMVLGLRGDRSGDSGSRSNGTRPFSVTLGCFVLEALLVDRVFPLVVVRSIGVGLVTRAFFPLRVETIVGCCLLLLLCFFELVRFSVRCLLLVISAVPRLLV